MAKILILEDEGFIALDLELAFEAAGHLCELAMTSEQAHDVLSNCDISGAVLDVSLGGGQTCESTAKELARRNIPFLLHTGDLNRVGEGLRRYGVPIIEKPTQSERVVERLLDLQRKAA